MAVLTLHRHRSWKPAHSASGRSCWMASALKPVTRQPSSHGATPHCSLARASARSSATPATTAPRQ
eukprot:12490775-Alexandrium_andersonii.AAC.1